MKTEELVSNVPSEFTRAQEALLRRIAKHVSEFKSDRYEFKNIRWGEGYKGAHYLSFAIGLKGDEGTMAEVFGRDRYHFRLGVRGGLKAQNGRRWVKGRHAIYQTIRSNIGRIGIAKKVKR